MQASWLQNLTIKYMQKVIKEIEGVPFYYVDICGRIWSKRKGELKLLKRRKTRTDHSQVHFKNKGKGFYIHRLVAKEFIPNPNGYPCVCHKDNNPLNNSVENLYWGTQQMNMDQAVKDGLMRGPQGESQANSKLNIQKIKLAHRLHNDFNWSKRKIWKIWGKAWGVCEMTIICVLNRKTWKHI
jgi:hypothetical protein